MDAKYPRYAGLSIHEVGMALDDLLATKLLQDGEPAEDQVRHTIPPNPRGPARTNIVGSVQANDVMVIFTVGSTRAFQPTYTMPKLNKYNKNRAESYIGGWMSAVRKIFPVSESEYYKTVVFGEVGAPDPFQI